MAGVRGSPKSALAHWGASRDGPVWGRTFFAIAAPVVGFGFWGAVDLRKAGTAREVLRLIQELAISGLAAFALYASGLRILAWVLAGLSLVHHALVYLLGKRLLKD